MSNWILVRYLFSCWFSSWKLLDLELHEFRINLNTDTFLGHSVTILNGNIIRQKKIEHQLTDIHNAPNGQLAKLQDDFLKLSEINRLLAGAIEVIFGRKFKFFQVYTGNLNW